MQSSATGTYMSFSTTGTFDLDSQMLRGNVRVDGAAIDADDGRQLVEVRIKYQIYHRLDKFLGCYNECIRRRINFLFMSMMGK